MCPKLGMAAGNLIIQYCHMVAKVRSKNSCAEEILLKGVLTRVTS